MATTAFLGLSSAEFFEEPSADTSIRRTPAESTTAALPFTPSPRQVLTAACAASRASAISSPRAGGCGGCPPCWAKAVLVAAGSASALWVVRGRVMGEASGVLLGRAEGEKALCSPPGRHSDGPPGRAPLGNA